MAKVLQRYAIVVGPNWDHVPWLHKKCLFKSERDAAKEACFKGAFTLGVKDFIGPYPHRYRDYRIGSNMLLNLLGSKTWMTQTCKRSSYYYFRQIVKGFSKKLERNVFTKWGSQFNTLPLTWTTQSSPWSILEVGYGRDYWFL
jgi:hypothetical protein